MSKLYRMVDTMTYDGLISGLSPEAKVKGVTIRAAASETALARGTILAKSSADAKYVVLGTAATNSETLTADCILADDITLGVEDANAAAYDMGCFDPNKVKVAAEYTITEADKDVLRERGIYLAAKAAN